MSFAHSVNVGDLSPETLDARFRRRLMSYFLARGQDRAAAEDLTQKTFLRLLHTERSYVENPTAFVFRVAASLMRDDRATSLARGEAGAVSLDDANVIAFPQDAVTPERELLGRDGLRRVLMGLEDLDVRTRDIFILFKFDHMRQSEIAERFGMTTAAVQKQILRATALLLARHDPL